MMINRFLAQPNQLQLGSGIVSLTRVSQDMKINGCWSRCLQDCKLKPRPEPFPV